MNNYETIEASIEKLETTEPSPEETLELGITGLGELKPKNPLAGRLKPVSTPSGAEKAALVNHKKKMTDKVFINFQATRILKTRLTSVSQINRINISEYFRKCAELLINSSNNQEMLADVEKLANSLTFKRKPRLPKTEKKASKQKSKQ